MAANASIPQLIRNVVSQYASFLIGVVASLVLTRVLLRQLGAGPYGLWIVLLAIVGYLGLLDVGVGTAAVQRIARLTAEGDSEGVADVIRTSLAFFAVSGILAVAVTAGLAPFLASFLNLGTISPTEAGVTLVLLGVMTMFTFLATAPNALLFGAGRGDRLAQIGLVTLILTEVVQILVVLAGGGLIALAVIQTAGVALGLVICAVAAARITGSPIRQGRFRRPLLRELIRFGGLQAVIAVSGVVAYQLDALVIGVILPVSQVAPYNIALNTSNLSRNLSTLGTNLLLPTYAHFETTGDRRRQAGYFFRSVLVSLVVSAPIVIALAAFGEPILHLWLGKVPPRTYQIMIALGIVDHAATAGPPVLLVPHRGGAQPTARQAVDRRSGPQSGRQHHRHLLAGSGGTGDRLPATGGGDRLRTAPDGGDQLPGCPVQPVCPRRAGPRRAGGARGRRAGARTDPSAPGPLRPGRGDRCRRGGHRVVGGSGSHRPPAAARAAGITLATDPQLPTVSATRRCAPRWHPR